MKKYTSLIAIIGLLAIACILIFPKKTPTISAPVNKDTETTSTTDEFTCIGVDGELTEAMELRNPIQVVWEAKFNECLVTGCHGATFTKTVGNEDDDFQEFPDFIGYYKDDYIPQQFLKKGLDLKIHGNMEYLYTDKNAPSIHNRCVPLVEIVKIEQL